MKHNASYEYYRDNQKQPACWNSPDNTCLPHFHSSLEFVYILDGQLNVLLDSHAILAEKGELIIVPSYTIHSYHTSEHSDTYVFTIPLDTIPSYQSILDKKTFASMHIKSKDFNMEIKHCLEEILVYINEDYHKYVNIIKGYSYVFLGLIIDQVGLSDIPNQKLTSLVQNILIYLQDHFKEPLTLEHLAKQYGYSKSRFSHIFNMYFGCSMTDYINGLRCRYALELIHQNSGTITEIALASGFESVRSFYRAFHKEYGHPPMQAVNASQAIQTGLN